MNEVLYEYYMLIDIIVHDALVICMSGVVHIAFIIMVCVSGAWYMMIRISFHGMTCKIPYRIGVFLLECE